MLKALILTLLSNSYGASAPITCNFPADADGEKSIYVVLEPRPSLKDQPGLFRVIMDLDGRGRLRAAAQPIHATDDRDILIRGMTRRKSMYTIGLREDGTAAFNIQDVSKEEVEKTTRIGACRGHEAHIDRWLSMW